MSDINFNDIPSALFSPGQFIEFSDVLANQGLQGQPHRMLLIGISNVPANAGVVFNLDVNNPAQGAALFGAGTSSARMAAAVLSVQNTIPVDAIGLAPAEGAAAAAGAVTITGAATANGELPLYVNGVDLSIPIMSGQTAVQAAAALLVEIQSIDNLPVTAVAGVAGAITLTAVEKGLPGNDIDIRVTYYTGDAVPAGLNVVVTPMAGGVGNPDITEAIAAIGDVWYTSFVNPFTDLANMAALSTELTSRWGPTRQIDGRAYMAMRGSQGALGTFGNGQNQQNFVTFTALGPSSPWSWPRKPLHRSKRPRPPIRTCRCGRSLCPASRRPNSSSNSIGRCATCSSRIGSRP